MRSWWKVVGWLAYTAVTAWFGFGWQGWLFGLGGVLALGLGLVDRLVYVWWLYPYEQISIQIQYWTRRGDARAVAGLLMGPGMGQRKLLFRSVGFAALWVLLAAYVVTSTGSILAIGIVMGLGYDLSWQIARDWKDPNVLGTWLCWQIKRSVSEKEIKWWGGIFVGIWLLFILRLVMG